MLKTSRVSNSIISNRKLLPGTQSLHALFNWARQCISHWDLWLQFRLHKPTWTQDLFTAGIAKVYNHTCMKQMANLLTLGQSRGCSDIFDVCPVLVAWYKLCLHSQLTFERNHNSLTCELLSTRRHTVRKELTFKRKNRKWRRFAMTSFDLKFSGKSKIVS